MELKWGWGALGTITGNEGHPVPAGMSRWARKASHRAHLVTPSNSPRNSLWGSSDQQIKGKKDLEISVVIKKSGPSCQVYCYGAEDPLSDRACWPHFGSNGAHQENYHLQALFHLRSNQLFSLGPSQTLFFLPSCDSI